MVTWASLALLAGKGVLFRCVRVQKDREVRSYLNEALFEHFFRRRADYHPVTILNGAA